MGLDYRGDTVAELRPHSVHGEKRLGRHIRLGFNVEMNIVAPPPENRGSPSPAPSSPPVLISLHSISGSISVQTTKQPIMLGHLYTDRPFWITTYPQHRTDHVTVYTDLTPDQIEALEEYRAGAGLNFSLNIMALTERQGHVDTKQDQIVFPVNQSAWLDILKQIGYGDFLLFEIPALPVATTETDYLVRLKEARQHLWLGQYDNELSRAAGKRWHATEKHTIWTQQSPSRNTSSLPKKVQYHLVTTRPKKTMEMARETTYRKMSVSCSYIERPSISPMRPHIPKGKPRNPLLVRRLSAS